MDRSGDLDDQYYEDVYYEPETLYENAELAFAVADDFNEVKSDLDFIIILLAIGVAFAGWASLLDDVFSLRMFFGGSSAVLLVISLVLWIMFLFVELPLEVFPL